MPMLRLDRRRREAERDRLIDQLSLDEALHRLRLLAPNDVTDVELIVKDLLRRLDGPLTSHHQSTADRQHLSRRCYASAVMKRLILIGLLASACGSHPDRADTRHP
jgi:hypothetical protein